MQYLMPNISIHFLHRFFCCCLDKINIKRGNFLIIIINELFVLYCINNKWNPLCCHIIYAYMLQNDCLIAIQVWKDISFHCKKKKSNESCFTLMDRFPNTRKYLLIEIVSFVCLIWYYNYWRITLLWVVKNKTQI